MSADCSFVCPCCVKMFAFVQYKFDGKTAVAKLSAIKDFTPENVADFESTGLGTKTPSAIFMKRGSCISLVSDTSSSIRTLSL